MERSKRWTRITEWSPFLIVTAYGILAGISIHLLDVLFHTRIADVAEARQLATLEHIFFATLTATILFVVVRRYYRRIIDSERALRQSERKFRTVLHSMHDLVFVVGADYRLVDAFGRTPGGILGSTEELRGKSIEEVFGEENTLQHVRAIESALAGESVFFEWRWSSGDSSLDLHSTFAPFRDGDGVISGAVAVMRDVTHQKSTDKTLSDTTHMLRAILRASPVGIVTINADGHLRCWNPAAQRIFSGAGFTSDETLRVDLPETGAARFREIRDAAIDDEHLPECEVRLPTPSGAPAILRVTAGLVRVGGEMRGVMAVLADVTEQKKNADTLQRYRLLSQHTGDVVLFVDPDRNIMEANDAAVACYGYSREELIGRDVSTLSATDSAQHFAIEHAFASDRSISGETTHVRRDGSSVVLDISAFGTDLEEGRVVLCIGRDATERQRTAAQQRLLHDLDRSILESQKLDDIVEHACHEIAAIFGCPIVQIGIPTSDGAVRVKKFVADAVAPSAAAIESVLLGSDGPCAVALENGCVVVTPIECDTRGTAIAVPLIAHGNILGTLAVFVTGAATFDTSEHSPIRSFADQVAISLMDAENQEQIHLQKVALDSAANAVLVTDAGGTIKWVNPAFTVLTGYSSDEAVGATPSLLKSGNHTRQFYDKMWETISTGRPWQGELYNRKKDGSLYIEEQTITPVHARDGSISHYVAVKQDITSRKNHEEQIRYLAMHDVLTDLPNRRALEGKLDRTDQTAIDGRSSAILIIDIDNFKLINDTLGHFAGDHLLSKVTTLLRNHLRPDDFLARLGGDEFAIVVSDSEREAASQIAERLLYAMRQFEFDFNEQVRKVSFSIGIAVIERGVDSRTALMQADAALYAAKDHGKNRFVAYPFDDSSGVRVQLADAGRWVNRITAALHDDSFVVHFQPVIHMHSGQAEHYEALIRLVDDDGSLIFPDHFLPVAERFGLMPAIDQWIFNHVMKVVELNDVRIFMNLSGASLTDSSLLDSLEQKLRESTLPPGRIAFEITESAAIRDLVTAQQWIRKLKNLGCLFALDDFGIGFSSFSYLGALSVDYVKIDRSFVRDLDRNPTNRALVQAVKTVAETLGKEVIAEGVESIEHLNALREIGISHGQGYHWGQPDACFPTIPVM